MAEKDEDTEDEDLSPEEMEKAKRVHDKTAAFFADVSSDMVPPEVIEKTEKKTIKLLEAAGLKPTVTNFKALHVGFEFGMASLGKLGPEAMMILLSIAAFTKARMNALEKEVDITKSKIKP